jgi:HSP20 family protein
MLLYGFSDPWWEEGRRGFDRLRREVEALFDQWGTAPAGPRSSVFPPVNLYETPDGFVLTAEVPGLRTEDLEVSIEGNRVKLRGERKAEPRDEASTSLHRRERQTGTFHRGVELPVAVDAEKSEARYRNGILMLRLPKAPEHRPRQIAIQG